MCWEAMWGWISDAFACSCPCLEVSLLPSDDGSTMAEWEWSRIQASLKIAVADHRYLTTNKKFFEEEFRDAGVTLLQYA